MLKELFESIVRLVSERGLRDEIVVTYPETSPFAGCVDHRRFIRRGHSGELYYEEVNENQAEPENAISELVVDHEFDDLSDLAEFVDNGSLSAWLSCGGWRENAAVVVRDIDHPETGKVSLDVRRHPRFDHWTSYLTPFDFTDLSHRSLADLVMDGQEDLVDPNVADHLAKFRAVRSVEYDADLSSMGHEGVKVSYKGSGGAEGPKADLPIPRSFKISIPAYSGAWDPGAEPKIEAEIMVRVVPPRNDSPPMFRLSWADFPAFELEAAALLHARVKHVLDPLPVFRGRPDSTRYVIPASK